ncbi:MAG: hypothetical protein ABW184_06920 [Sphingobium sp.]
MARISMTEADHLLVTDAVAKAEALTDGEIVTMIARRSDAYHDVALGWATGCAFVVLALAAAVPELFERFYIWILGEWHHELPLRLFMTMLFAHVVIKFLGVRFLLNIPALRMMLTPGRIRDRRVHARATALFRATAEARTARRTAILIYLSLDEHRAEILADRTIAEKVDPALWGDAMSAMLAEVGEDCIGEGIAQAVGLVGAVLAEHLPRGDDNPNELPDRLIEL